MPSSSGVSATPPIEGDPMRHEESARTHGPVRIGVAASPHEALGDWLSLSWKRHALALLVLLLATVLRFPSSSLSSVPLPDEAAYLRGFTRVAEGRTPYGRSGYFYPPALAHAGAWLNDSAGPATTLGLLRFGDLAGLAVVVWCSVAWCPRRLRLAVAIVTVAISPCVSLGVRFGNLSLLVTALVIVSLLWLEVLHRRAAAPWMQTGPGLLLAASLMAKPVAAVVPALLLVPSVDGSGRRRRFVVAAVASVTIAAALMSTSPYLEEFLALSPRAPRFHRSSAFVRLLYLIGLDMGPLLLLPVLVSVAAIVVWQRRLTFLVYLSILAAVALLGSPVVWSHTLLLALPAQLAALCVVISVKRGQQLALERVGVLLAVAAIQLSEGIGGLHDDWRMAQAIAILMPCMAPSFLAWYLKWRWPPPSAAT